MSKIIKIYARQVIDSQGVPTIEVEVSTKKHSASVIVPSGKSVSKNEAFELRDEDKNLWNGNGVLQAVKNVNKIIAPEIIGLRATNQKEIDATLIKLDNTQNKSHLGANAILGVSLAVCKVAAKNKKIPLWKYIQKIAKLNENPSLPLIFVNIINGGIQANNNVDFQEYMLVPLSAKDFNQGLTQIAAIFYELEKILKNKLLNVNKGDEGGFTPNLKDNEEPLKLILLAIKEAGYNSDKDFGIAIDIAASEFYDKKTKTYKFKSKEIKLTTQDLINYYDNLINKYPIISIEDPFADDDIEGFKLFTKKHGKKLQIIGDDLFVTNTYFLRQGIKEELANAILIKPNQIGTLTETLKTIRLAKNNNYNVIVSHCFGDSEDTFIADLAIGVNARQIKAGSFSRSERVAKYNQLIRISEEVFEFYGKNSINLDLKK